MIFGPCPECYGTHVAYEGYWPLPCPRCVLAKTAPPSPRFVVVHPRDRDRSEKMVEAEQPMRKGA